MEHPINRSFDEPENDPSLSVTALAVVLALFFIFYFTLRAAIPELALEVHHSLADVRAQHLLAFLAPS